MPNPQTTTTRTQETAPSHRLEKLCVGKTRPYDNSLHTQEGDLTEYLKIERASEYLGWGLGY
jgi:hypothetical protein